ncbi:MAG: DUF444 family protein [Ardenticatenales bacterium]|nr:DUF444 family protein [Ardenticatenales bacterium]
MASRIERDGQRFKQIARGQVRKNLKQYISKGEMIGRQGKNLVSIPVPQVNIPHFRYGSRQTGGVGQGEGEPGQPIAGDPQSGDGGAGSGEGRHILEVDLTLEELAQIMAEELELPRIEPKGQKNIISEKDRYSGIRRVGPESLRHFKRTYREALKRQISSGEYNFRDPRVVPVRDDRRYRSWKEVRKPESNAVIILMMDVSGSMGDEQKEIVRIETFWIDTWLRAQYQNLETRYIIHDAQAREVDRHTFFHTRESGGTMISSAYNLCNRLIDESYPPDEWNIYPFHFSDGENWGGGDTEKCMRLLDEQILPKSNIFCYGQVESYYGSGEFLHELRKHYPTEHETVILSQITGRDGILDSIKTFLGKGK